MFCCETDINVQTNWKQFELFYSFLEIKHNVSEYPTYAWCSLCSNWNYATSKTSDEILESLGLWA
jgi:hypothetical protein